MVPKPFPMGSPQPLTKLRGTNADTLLRDKRLLRQAALAQELPLELIETFLNLGYSVRLFDLPSGSELHSSEDFVAISCPISNRFPAYLTLT
jgi:hypothetical protein